MEKITSGVDALTGVFSTVGTEHNHIGNIGAGLKLAITSAVDGAGLFLLDFWIHTGFKIFLTIVVWEMFKWVIPHVMEFWRGNRHKRKGRKAAAKKAAREWEIEERAKRRNSTSYRVRD